MRHWPPNPAVALNELQAEQTQASGLRIKTQENKEQEMLKQEHLVPHESRRGLM